MKVSLVVPLKNEEDSFMSLYSSILQQIRQPDEVVFVDGGSTDKTTAIIEQTIAGQTKFRIIKTPQASPGKGRNIGVENASFEWIAFTDAGIRLENDWLEKLVAKASANPDVDIVYGNYAPEINSYFEKIATLSYVPAQTAGTIRGKSIASYLMKKKVWTTVGGFPDFRAAEDLVFMEEAEKCGFKTEYEPDAHIYWQLRPDLSSTFHKFVLYSKHNVWAGRQWDWHYGVLKQYLVLLPVLLLILFHSWWWLFLVILWLFARMLKRIVPHNYEFGWSLLFNPLILFGTAFLILLIDAATFTGWGQAVLAKKQ